ncbi:hypothetical protein TKK_0009753 [Trichogramma kaykai]|uniref:Calponin-homology (CH) domain-containing protein n=1 Tax=Trichogramma kaykai TaxID=54128 RepID=A0ABD2X1U9_9HYME
MSGCDRPTGNGTPTVSPKHRAAVARGQSNSATNSGHQLLRERVSFFEQLNRSSSEDLTDHRGSADHRRSSSRASNSSFEESFERLVEEGELNGAKVVKFEKITVKKSLKEVSSTTSVLSTASSNGSNDNLPTRHHGTPTQARVRSPSEASDELFGYDDSAYQSHNQPTVTGETSKSSSAASFAWQPASEESLLGRQCPSPMDDRPAAEWYAEYSNQSFFGVTAGRIDYGRSKSQYDAHIAEIKDEQERVQKKTFINWINSCLSKRVPPLRISDLIEDLKDGTRLLALLEILSGERLSVEKGRNLRRPHFLSNINTALQFLQSKKIKLVNINASDLVDGRPPVVLGLIWTIILYFQLRSKDRHKIEENARALEYLGQAWGSQSSLESIGTQGSGASERRRQSTEKWKQGARKTLLQWVTNALPKNLGVEVRDFGESWRDGNAFLGIIDAIKTDLVNIPALKQSTNRTRLETAFGVAENELGIARLLDPEDVDVPKPDEKCIMTYVAQFLHKYPEPSGNGSQPLIGVQDEFNALMLWLNEKVKLLDRMDKTGNFSKNYQDYLQFKSEYNEKSLPYYRMQNLLDTPSMINISRESWRQLQNSWKQLENLMSRWQWLLDSSLPGELGEVGRWLAYAESLLSSDDDISEEMTEETASIISQKLEVHKKFFLDLPNVVEKFNRVKSSALARQVPIEQLQDISSRLDILPVRAAKRRIKLKFLEHKCCLVAFLYLIETRLKGWSVKYGGGKDVQQMLEQYKNFVSKNRIFQEFQKAYADMQQVIEEYKREGDIDHEESTKVDRFIKETGEKWKSISMDLRCVQSMLEELVIYWRRWSLLSNEFESWIFKAESMLNMPEEEKMEYFQDISVWKDKYQQLSDTVSLLIATSEDQVAIHLKSHYINLSQRWENLFAEAKQYMHAGDLIRNLKDYRTGVEKIEKWLESTEAALATSQLTSTERIKAYGERLKVLNEEKEEVEELFKDVSKKFQTLIQDVSREEVDKMMNSLKKVKEDLVRVRAMIPMQLHLYHQVLVQQESLEAGQREISAWLDDAEHLLSTHDLSGGREAAFSHLERHKAFFSRTPYYKSMLESKNKVFTNIMKSVDDGKKPEGDRNSVLSDLNDRFARVHQSAQLWEQRLYDGVKCWTQFRERERQISEWLSTAETLINDRNIDSRPSVEYHKNFFSDVNENWMHDLFNVAQDLRNLLPVEQRTPIDEILNLLQKRWKNILTFVPLHLMRLEFRLDEVAFHQYLKEIEMEINAEQQSLMKNEDASSILRRNKDFFVNHGKLIQAEKTLQMLKNIEASYRNKNPNDTSLKEAVQNAEQAWLQNVRRIENLNDQLRKVPEQWANYRQKFEEMSRWMDHIDTTVRTLLQEVNTLELFEKEKSVFQELCQETDNKQEDMKWLMQTLNSLTSNRSDHEASVEQHKLEQLIVRYKNLIPTIDITMTKTDTYSKSYTYRKEVHEVCTLLSKVREQTIEVPKVENPESLKNALVLQESYLHQLEQQRAHIVSMLQQGKDLLKDQYAPTFVSSNVQELEHSWNETYGQNIENLQTLKNSHKLWTSYDEQKEEILNLISQAEDDLQRLKEVKYYNASQVSADLHNQQEINSSMRKMATDMVRQLQETHSNLVQSTPLEKISDLNQDIINVEKSVDSTMLKYSQQIESLQSLHNRWSNFQRNMNDLHNWATQNAPQYISDIKSPSTSPNERVMKIEILENQIHEKVETLHVIEREFKTLVHDNDSNPQAHNLKMNLNHLQSTIDSLQKNILDQHETASRNLSTWKEYELRIQQLKPWIDQAEAQAASIGSKPTTLQQATDMLNFARCFEKQCNEHLPRLEQLTQISHQLGDKTVAPDEADSVHSRWQSIHDVAIETRTKLEKLVSHWTEFEKNIQDFNEWLTRSESLVGDQLSDTASNVNLEEKLNTLKEFNKEITDRQVQFITLTQVSDNISHSLTLEGATNLKGTVSELKSRASKLADTVRQEINKSSDSILARDEFQMRLSQFEHWILETQQNMAQMRNIHINNVEDDLQTTHAFLQDYSYEESEFKNICEGVSKLKSFSTPEEAAVLNDKFEMLKIHYRDLGNIMRDRIKRLEKWSELLNWNDETAAQINHFEYEADTRKPSIEDCDRLTSEVKTMQNKIKEWKEQVQIIDSWDIYITDKEKNPITAESLINNLEKQIISLESTLLSKRSNLQNLSSRWENFRKMQQKLTENILQTQNGLQELTYTVTNCEQLSPAIEKIAELNERHNLCIPAKDDLHQESMELLRDDQRSSTNIHVVLSSIDSNWEKVHELLHEQRNKYAELEGVWKQYVEANDKLNAFIEESVNLSNSVKSVPCDLHQASSAVETQKRALETLKKGKVYLEKVDSKSQQILKEASLMPNFNHDSIESNVSNVHKKYQDTYSNIVEKIQLNETQVIIWKQINDAKEDLTRWLNDTTNILKTAQENVIDTENARAKLMKFRDELPAHQLLQQGILTKTEQLLKLNGGVGISTLASLNHVISEQFEVVESAANALEKITSNFAEQEKVIRLDLKKVNDIISKVREEVIKCDDLTGENVKIINRIKHCAEMKVELNTCDEILKKADDNIKQLATQYPSVLHSSLLKELQSLHERHNSITNHAEKVFVTLKAFLIKLYNEKFNYLQRMVSSCRDKVTWCEPDQNSDKYNLEVKLASLLEAEVEINDCNERKRETDKTLQLLSEVENPENLQKLQDEREKVHVDLEALKLVFQAVKKELEKNIQMWLRYEAMLQSVLQILKGDENRVRAESSTLFSMEDIETKQAEIGALQKEFKENRVEMNKLITFSNLLTEISPDSRIQQYINHLDARFEAIEKFIVQQISKLQELYINRIQYLKNLNELESLISKCEETLKIYEEIGGAKPMSFYQSRLNELKAFNEEKEKGQSLYNSTAEAAEALYPKINPEEREAVRSGLRILRSRLDNLTDKTNLIHKKVESDMMHRSSFEDKYSQVRQWILEAQGKLGSKQELLPTLQEKKVALLGYKTVAQDVKAHKSILMQLQERFQSMPDDESNSMINDMIESYDKLSEEVEDRVNVATKYVANHEAYQQTFDSMRDWISTIVNETSAYLDDTTVERETAKSSINFIENILQQREEGDRLIEDCNLQLNIILEQTSLQGHPTLMKAFEEQKKIWQDFLVKCDLFREKVNHLFDEWSEFQKIVEELEVWTKNIESQMKDQSLKSSEEAKVAHLQRLKSLEEEINAKAPAVNLAFEKSQAIETESELISRVSKQVTKYQALKNQIKEAVSRYELFSKEHNEFNQRYNHFVNWIQKLQGKLDKYSEIVGNLHALQERQKAIRDLVDIRSTENPKFESVIDLGERLYTHTSPDGREIIRQQLRNLRTLWDTFSDNLQATSQKLDLCLTQFSDFSNSHEQLNSWLHDVERAMLQHTIHKCTLEEKKALLQNHKIMHQEITSRQSLVEAVCEKAQQLVDQTKDSSLHVYLNSIKQLFNNIVTYSRDLLEHLEDCADKHNKFILQSKAFSDWLQGEKEKLLECNDLSGERTDISKKLALLTILKDGKEHGMEMIKKLKDAAEVLNNSTAPKGQEVIQNEISNLEAQLNQHIQDIDSSELKQNIALQKWKEFEEPLEKFMKWFREMEAAFRDHPLHPDIEGKQAQLKLFKEKREIIIQRESEIDQFVDKTHVLINSSGVERIKPLISQISNRYTSLLSLSKDVINRCIEMVEDHKNYNKKLSNTDAWLTPLEQHLLALNSDELIGNPEARNSRLQLLLSEQDQSQNYIENLVSAGERILPDTSSGGREIIRQQIRQIRERWENLTESIAEQQKKQGLQSLQWSSCQENLQQIYSWLDNMERTIKQEVSVMPSSLQEVRSKLIKGKTLQQEILSYKRVIESISEKANSLVQVSQLPVDIQDKVQVINQRFERLVENSTKGLVNLEAVLEVFQCFHDLQKSFKEYQKEQWDQLTSYSDFTGNKAALQSKLTKVIEIQDHLVEGEVKLNALEEHLSKCLSVVSPRSQESMERDLNNLRFDNKKFADSVTETIHSFEERIQQWNEYESSLERLLIWLMDAETLLKNYCLKNSIEEKEEQLERYQDLLKVMESRNADVLELVALGDHLEQVLLVNLRQNETEFDKMSDSSSDLINISGETRFSVSVQQITSRFQSVQSTAKELVKKCDQALMDHRNYIEKYKQCSERLAVAQQSYTAACNNISGTRQELMSHMDTIRDLLSRQSSMVFCVNSTVEAGERLYSTTGSDGREIIRQQLLDLQHILESLFDGITLTEREMQSKISRWSGFVESSETFNDWLKNVESHLQKGLELKATLDEKRAQLQIYRNALHDIQTHQQDLLDLKDKADSLPERSEKVDKALNELTNRHAAIMKKASGFVETYETYVSDHQKYSKAVLDTHEWLDATLNAVHVWGDIELDRVSLHTNLDRLQNLLQSFSDDEARVSRIRSLGEKVIPGTLESGQINIRSQMDSSQQEWESLLSTVKSTTEALKNKLQLWDEYEVMKEHCLSWLRDTDTKLHAVDLKSTLDEKKEQLEKLRNLQGEIRAKELEMDNVTERAHQLHKQSLRSSQISELGVKYQQLSVKVKDLNNRWQQYVMGHQEFDNQLSECNHWLDDIRAKLTYCSDLSASSQKDLEKKMEIIQDLLVYKESGFAKIQKIVELAQGVLANTATAGHSKINEAVAKLQEQWSSLASKMLETKTNLDDSINKWAGLLEQIQNINKTVELMEGSYEEISTYQTTMSEKRSQLDKLRILEEKGRCENIEVDGLKSKVEEMIASGQQSTAASQAKDILNKFDDLFGKIKSILSERQDQYKHHKLYKEAHDDLIGWLNRAREKIPSSKQRSLSDKLAIENAVAPLESLMNKKAQGELMVEQLQHTGQVVCVSTSPQGQEVIRNEIRALTESFESLYKEIQHQKDQLEFTVGLWRDFKDEYERLSDWLQQSDILIKAQKNSLLPDVKEKEKQVKEVKEILSNLSKGQDQIDKFNKSAAALQATPLESYVNNQLRHLNSRYQVQVNLAKDVLQKVETNFAHHREYENNLGKTRDWINNAKQIIRQGTDAGSTSSREELQERLDKIQELLRKREEGQNLVHLTVNSGEKVLRNTRSDGREQIATNLKEIQNDWERLVKKISTTKVHLETSLLQWADYSSSYSQLQQWINDREAKLQQACEQKVSKARKGVAGLNSLAIGERKANLRQTNSIVQDIVAFEPMIQSVTTKAEDLQQATPATEISIKYETLSKQAQELYAKQKETVELHQAFIDSGNEFIQWIRVAKERLGKCSEPTGDKDSLASKISLLKVLENDLPEGQKKLQKALEHGNAACQIADNEEKEIIEEEVALLQEEYDNYVDSLSNTKNLLEIGIVKWTEYEDQFSEAAEWLSQTEKLVQSFNKLQDSLEEKKNVLEQFQGHLQTLFDWQKDLDRLNMRAQMLLETCADTRISNAVTQLTTKYNALLSLAKEIMRRLELHYQEHQQHNTLYQECQDWIDRTRDKLNECKEIPNSLMEINSKLHTCKMIRQSLEQGQNKLRYALELKEKVIMNTEHSGALKIRENTDNLKSDFDKLLNDVEEIRQRLAIRAGVLEELNKVHRMLVDWLEEVESNIQVDQAYRNDLSEKRALLEKYKTVQRDMLGHSENIEKFKLRLADDTISQRTPYDETVAKYEELWKLAAHKIQNLESQVKDHETYQHAFNEASDWVRRMKIDLQQYSITHGEREKVAEREGKVKQMIANLPEGQSLISKVIETSQTVLNTTGQEGQDTINHDVEQLQDDWQHLQHLCQEAEKTLSDCLLTWSQFIAILENMQKWIDQFRIKINNEQAKENKTPEDLERCKSLIEEALRQKPTLEDLNDKCELLMEMSVCNWAREKTVQLQSAYTGLLTDAQGLVSKVEKNLSDHTEFLKAKKELGDWLWTAHNSVQDCVGVGDVNWAKDKLGITKDVVRKIGEGSQLLSCLQNVFAKAINTAPSDQQEELRNDMSELRSSWEQLTMDLNTVQAQLKSIIHRWEDFYETRNQFEKWLNQTEEILNAVPNTKGELGEMKTYLEKYKHINEEVRSKKSDLDHLVSEAAELSHWAKDDTAEKQVDILKSRWASLEDFVHIRKNMIDEEIKEYNAYHLGLQDIEKWLLQVSFQLMAHNSLYIVSKEQTLEQISTHQALLTEIRNYESVLDELKTKGEEQILTYEESNPQIRPTISTQLENVRESYKSLLTTALQIESRLNESLSKFQEYENTLESILNNLDEYEPQVIEHQNASLDTLELAEENLASSKVLYNKLLSEKARLALAVEACEAAAACLSRPGSPLDSPSVPIPAKEMEVRTRLDDVIDQMQSHLSNVLKTVNELEDQTRQRNALVTWINQQRALCVEWKFRPVKLRAEAAQSELQTMNDLLTSVGEKRHQAEAEQMIRANGQDNDIEENLDKLEAELIDAIASKQASHELIQKYRNELQDIHSWFDALSKKIDVIEKGSGLTISQKITSLKEITSEFEVQGPNRIGEVKKLAEQVMDSVSNLDSQQIEEQMKSVERRQGEISKKLQRKAQVLEMTAQGIDATRREIEENREWISEKKRIARSDEPLGYESRQADERLLSLKSILKEAESKKSLSDSFEKRVGNMQNELETTEQQQLETETKALRCEQAELCSILREEISAATAAVETRRKLENDLEKARLWIKATSNDLKKLSGYLPLKASKVEEDIKQHSGLVSEIRRFSEGSLKDLLKHGNAMLRECNEGDRQRLQALLDKVNEEYQELQKEAHEKQAALADLLQGRKAFESELDKCQRWITEAEVATAAELRKSSIDVLREQLAKYDRLKKEAKEYADDIEKIVQQGKSILPTISDADKQELSEQLKNMREQHSRVAGVINERSAALQKNIDEAEEVAARVAEAVQFMTTIQEELQDLNKPIGSRVEDVEGMLAAYERILDDLKTSKAKLSDLGSSNVGELHGVISQQDDLIRTLEAQISKLRQLLLLRQQFIALVTEIMTFIAKYTEIVRDIEKGYQTTEEKIKKYEDVIVKIQECEATLASATDKGQQIAVEGSAADKNNITEQLQSLKQQLQTLRRAVENQREKHEQAAAEHRRLANELADILDFLEGKEKEVKTRPLLERHSESVEAELEKHKVLCKSVNEYLDKIKEIKESMKHEDGMPGSLKEMFSEAVSLLTSLPREMEERENYLESNKQMRTDYATLREKLHGWVREAEIRLESDKDGLDFENILSDLEEHKIYFSSEASIRELVSQQIQQAADKIWPSLSTAEQEELSAEQQHHTQLLKNTLNTAKSHRARLEQGAETWRDYSQTLERVKAVIARTRFTDEPVSTLAGLQFNIQKITHALNDIQNQHYELDLYNERSKEIIQQADGANKRHIEKQLEEISNEWQQLVSSLETRQNALEALSKHWEELEAKWSGTETKLTAIDERGKLVDTVVRSKQHLLDTIKALNELTSEAETLRSDAQEVRDLAGPILSYLAAFTEKPARALEERIDKLSSAVDKLVDLLQSKSEESKEDLQSLRRVDEALDQHRECLESILERITSVHVYDSNQEAVERELSDIGRELDSELEALRRISEDTKTRYQNSQQLIPIDLGQKLAALELRAEDTSQAMEEKQRAQKRAKTTRTDYLADADELQKWLREAELKVQDRSCEPSKMMEHLRQIQSELAPITDKLERMSKNGKTIVDNTKDEEEKQTITTTIAGITEQLAQVKSWLDEKKQQVGDTLDAWQRFLTLLEAVKAWTAEKRVFLQEPLRLSSLSQARQKLHEYATAVKSCKHVNKNLSDMGRELESISQVTSVGDLPYRLTEVEEAKVEVEGHLLERNALLQETSEEWEQCERKMKEVKVWLDKARQSLDSAQNKKKPLRDQHAIREKMLSDVTIQKTKVSMSVEKLQVHFRSGIGGDSRVVESADEIVAELNVLNETVKEQTASLEACLAQLDKYHQEIQQLRQQIVQVEQQLRTVLSPTYSSNDREKAQQEQQTYQERIKSLQSKIQARSERSKLLLQRGTPDAELLEP